MSKRTYYVAESKVYDYPANGELCVKVRANSRTEAKQLVQARQDRDNADFLFANTGSMIAVTPMSAAANKAVDAGLIQHESWQISGGSIMVDPRMAGDLLDHLRQDGFSVVQD
jgi:hypothetical protein